MKLGTNDIGSVYLGTNAVSSVYLGTNLVWSGTDPDYQAVLDYATTQGYTLPSASQQTLQNQLVVDLKTAGIWSKLDTFAMFANDGSLNFGLIDWIRLTDYTGVNSPTFTSNQGFQGDGVSSYIDSNFNPSTQGVNYQATDYSFGWYMRVYDTVPTSGEGAWQCTGGGNNHWLRYTAKRFYYSGVSFNTYANLTIGANQFAIGERDGSSLNIYANGILTDTSIAVPSAMPNGNFTALYQTFVPNYSNAQLSFVYAGASMTTVASSFNTAINTYLSSL